jgi:hypothetical protein
MAPIVPNTNPNLLAVISTERECILVPILYWVECRTDRYPVLASQMAQSILNICSFQLPIYDRTSRQVFTHDGLVHLSLEAFKGRLP